MITKRLRAALMRSFCNGGKSLLYPDFFVVVPEGQEILNNLLRSKIYPDMDDISLDCFTVKFVWSRVDQFWIVK